MASDRKEFNRALHRWDMLRSEHIYSEPEEYGLTAILYSGYSIATSPRGRREEVEAYEDEANTIYRTHTKRQIGAFILAQFTYDDLMDTVRDTTVSSMVVIGNGSFQSLCMNDGVWINWQELAENATHLKTGTFTQRFCGHLATKALNVPFGTFAMKDHARVRAATGRMLPMVLKPEHEALIQPVHDKTRLDYDTVKALFPGEE